MRRLPFPFSFCVALAAVSVFALKVPGAGFWGPVLMLGGLVFLHEGGHFLAAKYMGMPVEVFSLGFGPRLLGFKWRETDVRLSALPLGGYVKLAGFNPEEPGADDPYGFLKQPYGKRMLFYSGGILANLATTLVLFTFVGADQARVTKRQESWTVIEVVSGGAADQGGLKVGDELRGIGDLHFPGAEWDAAVAVIQAHAGQPLPFHLTREGKPLELALVPRLDGGKGRLGFMPLPLPMPLERRAYRAGDFLEGGGYALSTSWRLSGQVFGFLKKLVTFQARSAEVAGPIGIIRQGSRAAKASLMDFLFMCGAISLQLALLNALPIPALDGGHMALLTFEKLRRKDLTIELKEKILTGGFLLLASLMALVIVLDLLKLRK
ncbi:MAG: site-2 protease family protein [Geothrix sp.]|uniref:M50 family metallopeptidase n=1 Tax=Geothrix sp. TaxID=1962974 RepID=UPI001805C1B0|nr:site-2 protease family protein [Geothrix sp.]NWJ41309.1 site-2 protease family protein [Geothrix sp.]WIL20703.1 MAG: site-2 protease family protein [Geothrix sp.]